MLYFELLIYIKLIKQKRLFQIKLIQLFVVNIHVHK